MATMKGLLEVNEMPGNTATRRIGSYPLCKVCVCECVSACVTVSTDSKAKDYGLQDPEPEKVFVFPFLIPLDSKSI